MTDEVPYMPSVKNLHSILDKIVNAKVPESFSYEFIKDLGFRSSSDRPIAKLLKFLGFLDQNGKPLTPYREFVNNNQTRRVLAERLTHAYDDLFTSDKNAQDKSAQELTGWFKTKTGASESVAKKIATTFKALADYADFNEVEARPIPENLEREITPESKSVPPNFERKGTGANRSFGLNYRIEIILPETTNIETYRSIFKALREELL